MKNAIRFPWEFDGETVVFETPEQTRIEYRIAPLGTRLVAALLDRLLISSVVFILWALLLLCLLVLAPAIGTARAIWRPSWWSPGFSSPFFILFGRKCAARGKPGASARLHIRTLMFTGQGVTLGASLVRNLARVGRRFSRSCGYFRPSRVASAGWGDLLAGTLVVMAETADAPRARRQYLTGLARKLRGLVRSAVLLFFRAGAKLYPDDLNLLEHLEERFAAFHAAAARSDAGGSGSKVHRKARPSGGRGAN